MDVVLASAGCSFGSAFSGARSSSCANVVGLVADATKVVAAAAGLPTVVPSPE
eukprot:CAMPEP_0204029074 /NCGR_PEP_ID=MMETSP0360-20130528/54560_1 /ASSEMBLY_ACC=CAM_ASM_000342 /TAXON_ID=268821 /ORGANISM="Scrippsiella Hangoei, Strain SHTV-5" /LENGTH=52 /DNA_ID=CAMNT_0050972983 /DNA_START=50 /DNA_END=208 /DNA_ORIENTATION=-